MTVCQLANIVGQIVFMNLWLGSVARLMAWSLYTIINTPRCELKDSCKLYKLKHEPEEILNLKFHCILVSAMVHLP